MDMIYIYMQDKYYANIISMKWSLSLVKTRIQTCDLHWACALVGGSG